MRIIVVSAGNGAAGGGEPVDHGGEPAFDLLGRDGIDAAMCERGQDVLARDAGVGLPGPRLPAAGLPVEDLLGEGGHRTPRSAGFVPLLCRFGAAGDQPAGTARRTAASSASTGHPLPQDRRTPRSPAETRCSPSGPSKRPDCRSRCRPPLATRLHANARTVCARFLLAGSQGRLSAAACVTAKVRIGTDDGPSTSRGPETGPADPYRLPTSADAGPAVRRSGRQLPCRAGCPGRLRNSCPGGPAAAETPSADTEAPR